jgi:hypothetical protein
MERINTKITLLIVVIFATSMLSIAGSLATQSTPKPFIPQFSIKVVDYSYDVPTTYSTDSYTGKQITNPGYHVEDIRIEGKIKNQPFIPYTMPNPNSTSNYDATLKIDFYYNIRYKGHFGSESEWMNLVGTRDADFLIQNYGFEYTNFTIAGYNARMFEEGAVIDLQVKAYIGFETWGFVGTFPYRILNGEESGWSNTLTITISKDAASSNTYATNIDNSPYPTITSPQPVKTTTPTSIISEIPTPSPTPSVPEFSWLTILPLLLAIPIFFAVRRKTVFRHNN